MKLARTAGMSRSGYLNGLVRDAPRIVPPRAMIPSVSREVEGTAHALDEPAPALEDPDARAALVDDPLDDGADDRVEARAIAAAGQQTDFHEMFLTCTSALIAKTARTARCR